MKKILVLTATLGERESLQATIDSVRSIGGERVRHVLICPEGKSDELKEKYGVECLVEPKNVKGIYGALNYGFDTLGKYHDYFTYINDDDHWMPSFNRIIDAIEEDNNLDLVYGRVYYTNEKDIIIGKQASSGRFTDFCKLLSHNITLMTQQASLMRCSLFEKFGRYDLKYKIISDTKLWAQISRSPIRFLYVDDYCATYMIQDGQISSDKVTREKEMLSLKEELGINSSGNIKELCFFRITNIVLYIQRFLINRSFENPFMV